MVSYSGGRSSARPSQSNLVVPPLLFILFSETVVMYTVYPFITKVCKQYSHALVQILIDAKMVGNLDVVHGEKEKVGYYLGILVSLK